MRRTHLSTLFTGLSFAALLAACGSSDSDSSATGSGRDLTPAQTTPQRGAVTVGVGSTQFSAALADTATARAFAERLPLTLDMTDVNSNEKAFELAETLPADPANRGTIRSGDLMLYGSDTIVLFYETFDTSYAYTRIGRLDDPDSLADVLGAGDVTVTFAHP